MPNVLLEALSHKIPLIISKETSEAITFIKNNKSGIILKNNSFLEAGSKINLLANNYEMRKKLGFEGYKTIKKFAQFNKIYLLWKKEITQ